MSRQHLPLSRPTEGESALFPSLQKEMNRLLDQFRSGFPLLDEQLQANTTASFFPAIDVTETEDSIAVTAEVPGVKEDDLDVTVAGQTLILKGEKRADLDQTLEGQHRIERRYGRFQRQIPIGFEPEEGAVDARFSEGVLRLRIAKPTAEKIGIQKISINKA